MTNSKQIPKIIKKVEGEGELNCHEREVYFNYEADVLVSCKFEVLEVRPEMIMVFDRDGEEIEPTIEENTAIVERVMELAAEKAMESLESSDFEDEEEES